MRRTPTSTQGCDNDMDRAEILHGPEDAREAEDRGRELNAAEMFAELSRVFDRIRGIEQSAHRCAHGINLERARCARCEPIGATE